jgi:hypothetical protein
LQTATFFKSTGLLGHAPNVGQPIVAAAGFQPALTVPGSKDLLEGRLRANCRPIVQNAPSLEELKGVG